MSGEKARTLKMIINTASYERVAYALSLAVTHSALGGRAHVLFGYGGVLRLKKGASADEVGEETDGLIRREIGRLKKGAMPKISELIRQLHELGGKIYACPAAMALHNLTRDDLIGDVDMVCGLATFLTLGDEDAMIIYV